MTAPKQRKEISDVDTIEDGKAFTKGEGTKVRWAVVRGRSLGAGVGG